MFTRWTDFDRSFAALDTLRRQMDRMLSEFEAWPDARWAPAQAEGASWPRMSLHDDGGTLQLYAELPGLSEKDVELSLNQNVLTIAGQRAVAAPEGYSVHRQERGSYRFSRSISLPCAVDPEKTSATVKDGILAVTLEKVPEAKPRQITVKAR